MQPAYMRDFNDVTSRTMVVADPDITEVIATDDCSLTISQKTFANSGTQLTFSAYRKYTFEPTGCSLNATVGGQVAVIDSETTVGDNLPRIFVDSDSSSQDASVEVVVDDDVYDLSTLPLSNFGCGEDDVFIHKWKKTS